MSTSNVIGLWALMPFRTGNQRFASRIIKPKHEEFEIVLSGRAVFEKDGQETLVGAGDVIWMHEGEQTIHSDPDGTPYECVVLSFLVKEAQPPSDGNLYRWTGPLTPKQFTDDALHCLQRCRYDSLTYCHYLYSACRLHLVPFAEANQHGGSRLDGILNFLQVNIREHLSTESIAENFNLTTNQLNYLFHQEFGLPPYQYLKRLRLQRAEAYLTDTDKPVKWIAYMCGYQSESGFIRAFGKTHQMAPLEYRQLHGSASSN